MDKQGFVFAFDEVEDDHRHRELLGGRERAIVVVDVASCKEEGQVDEDGSGVFDDEDSEPRDLEAWGKAWISTQLGARRMEYLPRSLTKISFPAITSWFWLTRDNLSFKILFFVSKIPNRLGSIPPICFAS